MRQLSADRGEQKVILLNLNGHDLTNMTAYDQYLNGDLINCSLSDDDIKKNINALDSIG